MAEQSDDPVEALFDRAVTLPLEERAAFLDAACRGNPGLRAEVESLLAHDQPTQNSDGWLQSPLVRGSDSLTAGDGGCPPTGRPGLPQKIGHYRILRCLGEGGMGIVYKAEQDNPRRPVALKVVRPGRRDAGVRLRRLHSSPAGHSAAEDSLPATPRPRSRGAGSRPPGGPPVRRTARASPCRFPVTGRRLPESPSASRGLAGGDAAGEQVRITNGQWRAGRYRNGLPDGSAEHGYGYSD
jgi:hypothetical protein